MLNKILSLKKEILISRPRLLGISTFFTLSFIIAVNPAILSDAGIDFAAGFVATIIASALGCFMIGIWAGWPVAIAPGMGLNAYFAYVVVLGYGFSWQQALAAVFTSSVLFFLFSLSRARSCQFFNPKTTPSRNHCWDRYVSCDDRPNKRWHHY